MSTTLATRPDTATGSGLPSEWTTTISVLQVQEHINSGDSARARLGWSQVAGHVDDSRVEGWACRALRTLARDKCDQNCSDAEVILHALTNRTLPLTEATIDAVGAFVSGPQLGTRLAALRVLAKNSQSMNAAKFIFSQLQDGHGDVVNAALDACLGIKHWQPAFPFLLLFVHNRADNGKYGPGYGSVLAKVARVCAQFHANTTETGAIKAILDGMLVAMTVFGLSDDNRQVSDASRSTLSSLWPTV